MSAALLRESATLTPPAGADWDRVTVQVVVAAELTVAGEQASVVTVGGGGVIVTGLVAKLPFSEAVTVTVWLAATVPEEAVKPPFDTPAAIVTDAGTVSAALLSDTATVTPPAGAACDKVTVQPVLPPDATVAGEHTSADTVTGGGVTVTDAVAELPFNFAVTVTA